MHYLCDLEHKWARLTFYERLESNHDRPSKSCDKSFEPVSSVKFKFINIPNRYLTIIVMFYPILFYSIHPAARQAVDLNLKVGYSHRV